MIKIIQKITWKKLLISDYFPNHIFNKEYSYNKIPKDLLIEAQVYIPWYIRFVLFFKISFYKIKFLDHVIIYKKFRNSKYRNGIYITKIREFNFFERNKEKFIKILDILKSLEYKNEE